MSKITAEVQEAVQDVDGNTYIRVGCWLNELALPTEYREKLEKEMHCTHLMQIGRVASIEVPRRFLEELASWDVIREIKKVETF